MTSTFHGIEVSKRGLVAQQNALNITSHNISNASTIGYTRQRVNMVATNGIPAPGMNNDRSPGLLGTGVEVTSIQRLRESFLDAQFRTQYKNLGYWEAQSQGLQKLESIINEPSDTNLQKVMDNLWQSWQDLTKDPSSLSARAVVQQRALALTESFVSTMSSLGDMQNDLNNEIKNGAADITSMAKQIANLNKQIADLVPHGYTPNDLYDQRDVLLDKLSKMADVRVTEAENGMVNVTIQGNELVTGRNSVEMAAVLNQQTGFYDLKLGGADFVPQGTGSLAGKILLRGQAIVSAGPNGQPVVTKTGYIPEMMDRLNLLATNLAKEVNAIHSSGLNLNDIEKRKSDPTAEPEKLLFFVDANDPTVGPTSAATMRVNPAILKSLNAIAAAQIGPSDNNNPNFTYEGDGRNASAIASIKYKIFKADGLPGSLGETSTLDEYYRQTIAALGTSSQEAQRQEANNEYTTQQIDYQRMSVSNVNLDEELADMIRFQHAYSSAARMMTSMDEVLDKIINGMGRVGL